jgi:FKBP-type peptidyl-prolyl cis-trans isomerase SlyD
MQITKHAVASIEYKLTDDAGEVIDSSTGDEPLAYIHGAGNLIPGLESELEGKVSGDAFKVRVAPENAYGERQEEMVQDAPRSQFPEEADIQPGMQFRAHGPEGAMIVTVLSVEGDTVKLDGNHPLAGQHLTFDVKVVEVREATPEEIEHSHVHVPGGHEH